MQQISYAKTVYGQEEIESVIKCLTESTQMGKYTREFEQKIAKLFLKKECLFVNSGSSALYLGIESLSLREGGEVITPALTFSTTIGCLLKNKLIPVFVDVKNLTYCIDTSQIEEMITEKTVAILAPNLLGNLCDWPKIRNIADKYNLLVIEDSADTLGGTFANDKPTGFYTDMSITSFYGSHIINCAGNGGALTLNDSKAIENAKLLRSWGRRSSLYDDKSESIKNRFNIKLDGINYDAKFVFDKIGYNLEGSEIGAAFGLAQLKKLEENIKIRQKNFKIQCKFFKQYEKFFCIPEEFYGSKTAWLAFPVLINKNANFSRKEFQIFLEERKIQTRVIFTGNILRQPMCKGIKKITRKEGYPISDEIMKNGILLPLHHGMTVDMFSRLHNCIEEFLADKL